MLAAFDLPGVPHSGAVANARPIGPCRSYPSQDAWVDEPCVEGAVLVGDAAGYNDPILGQGLSVTLRDAYSVGTVLAEEPPYGVKGFAAYVEERRERLRRLRFAASFITTLYARFQPEDVERRAQAFKRMAGDPSLAVMPLAAFLGPEAVPAECFTPAFYERAFGSTEHMVA